MTNREIEFLLTLKDQLTAKWNSTMAQMKNSVKDLATTFQANWASITAGWFAVRQAVMDLAEWAQQWIKTETLAASFRAMVTQMGGDADKEFAKIKEAAAGMLEDAPIYQQANKLMSLGYSYKSIADLMVLSRVKAREYSITEQEAWERLSDAVARGAQGN